MKLKYIIIVAFTFLFLAVGGGALLFFSASANLPQIMKVEDYKPLLVSDVFARGGEKIGEFSRENRILVPFDKIPKLLVNSFIAAEDDTFYEHGGLNYLAILRASLANLRAGRTKQGASTITQQVAKSLLLTPERTLSRKIKEALLSYKMEENLSKQNILYLYLNQIYFGEGAYGVAAAAQTYFRKSIDNLTTAEMAMLAGLPQSPERYAPSKHPQQAKDRQRYVLNRMQIVGFITKDQEKAALDEPIQVYLGKEYKSVAPFYVETLRQMLVPEIGEDRLLNEGVKIYTSLDYALQQEANTQVHEGLRAVDKRQGYRGVVKHLNSNEEMSEFLLNSRKSLVREFTPVRVIEASGNSPKELPISIYHKRDSAGNTISNLPPYVSRGQTLEAVISRIDDKLGLTEVRFGDGQALIDVADIAWARKPDPSVTSDASPKITKPSQIFKEGDVIEIRITAERFSSPRLVRELSPGKTKITPENLKIVHSTLDYAQATLEQDPLVEASLLSFDQNTQDVTAMVGGSDFKVTKYNRALQAKRQTGSSFKALVYTSALDKGWTAASPVADTPVVFEEKDASAEEGQDDVKKYKPHNYENKFMGEMLFRNALIRSLNIPTVKILTDVGIDWATQYARRLGIFSPLANDITMGLGSSGVTLFEMTKAFSQLGRMGKRLRPIVIHKVVDHGGKTILENLSLDKKFEKELGPIDAQFEEKRKESLVQKADIPAGNNTATVSNGNNGAAAAAGQPAANTGDSRTKSAGAPNDVLGSPINTGGDLPTAKFKTPHLFFEDPEQLISPETAYLITSILRGVIFDEGGTAGRARALNRPAAGKTGTTNGFFDTWFIGYTPQYATGVWVGFDQEKTLGVGEAGAKTALPIWLEFMKVAHKDLPVLDFQKPENIVFANIDNKTGKLASSTSTKIVHQAFLRGTEPKTLNDSSNSKSDADLIKEDLSE